MEALGKLVLNMGLSLTASLFYAWAFSVIWGWFAIPAGLMALPYTAFLALTIMVSIAGIMVQPIRRKDIENADSDTAWIFVITLVKIIVVLAVLGMAGLLFLIVV